MTWQDPETVNVLRDKLVFGFFATIAIINF